jgi:hypothetical protein
VDVEDRLIELSRKAAASSLTRTSSPDVAAGIVDLAWELRDEIDAIAEKMRSRKAEQ